MIYNEDIAHIELECDCGCSIVQLVVDRIDKDADSYFQLYELAFYAYQKPFWSNFKENLKLIWSIIRGRRFCLYGVIIPKERMEEFKKFVASIE